MSTDELLRELLDEDPYTFTPTLHQWLSMSRRFRTFAEQDQTKIRAQLRGASDEGSAQERLFELAIAYYQTDRIDYAQNRCHWCR
ncbi:MAG: hypothetical protein KF832_29425 [Caldilineaceae bacterium]|nr:hypothetical protein [Caldilineaceae bacterium]